MAARRDSLDIIVEVLKHATTPRHKSYLVIKANVNHRIIVGVLEKATNMGLIVKEGSCYRTTEAGHKLLSKYQEIVV